MKILNFLSSVLLLVLTTSQSYAQFSTSSGNTTTSDKVGIGTNSPTERLEVFGTTGAPGRITMGDGGNWSPFIKTYKWIGTGSNYYQTTIGNSLTTAGAIEFQTGAGGGAIGSDAQTTRMVIMSTSGNVGIGTTSPTAKLSVSTDPGYANGINIYSSSGDQFIESQRWLGTGFVYGASRLVTRSGSWGVETAPGTTIGAQVFTEQLTVLTNGNVGIGTTDPKGYKLAVNGDMIATSIKVKLYSAWPDYVFKPNYKLTPLSEVKTYIDKNQHLPEMPSAAQVEKEGLNLGEMNRLLLKKVEELTLFLIEKDKWEKQQDAKLKKMQKQIKKLNEKLKVN